jgi:hypothetical protein
MHNALFIILLMLNHELDFIIFAQFLRFLLYLQWKRLKLKVSTQWALHFHDWLCFTSYVLGIIFLLLYHS